MRPKRKYKVSFSRPKGIRLSSVYRMDGGSQPLKRSSKFETTTFSGGTNWKILASSFSSIQLRERMESIRRRGGSTASDCYSAMEAELGSRE